MAEAHRPAQHGRARQMSVSGFHDDRLIERAAFAGFVVLADENAQKHGVARKRHGSDSASFTFDPRLVK